MNSNSQRWALISVSDKTGLVELGRELVKNDIGILTTGGSAKILQESEVPQLGVSQYTGHPEIMGGRVKTLHPKIHGGILGRSNVDSDIMDELEILNIDFVFVNLYPFEETIARPGVTFDEAIEKIDIGGPALLRAAAKNHSRVTVVCDPNDYPDFISNLSAGSFYSLEKRRNLAAKSFRHVSKYDEKIADFLSNAPLEEESQFPAVKKIYLTRKKVLRYGENPHQSAAIYNIDLGGIGGIAGCKQLSGKQLSFNNVVDADAANDCSLAFSEPACVIVKHANPCGVAECSSLEDAYNRAFLVDPTSAFGGVIGFNRLVTEKLASQILSNQFVEVVVAPKFAEGALKVFSRKENIRILEVPPSSEFPQRDWDMKSISGGILIQEKDSLETDRMVRLNSKVVTDRKPSEEEKTDLYFAWKVATFVKSNAIVFARNRLSIGIGAGQMSRVYSAKLAGMKAEDVNLEITGSVMASDAFFPFRDGIDEAAKQGIRAIIQPGGSMRDEEVIAAADENAIAMIFTGRRHFRH